MGCLLVGDEKLLRCLREAPGLFSLGTLAGDALTVRRCVLNQAERVRRETKLVLRNRKASAWSSHGVNHAGCKSAAKRLPYLVRGSRGVLAVNCPHGCCQACRLLRSEERRVGKEWR